MAPLGPTTPGDTPLVPRVSMATPALGGHGGGAPLNVLDSLEQIAGIVRDGQNNMPPFSAALTPQQILDVSAYALGAFSRDP